MRTKKLLLTAALCVAGALSSMAQSNVYSLNVVGYINLNLAPGLSLVAPQLVGTNNDVTTVLGNANLADNSLLYLWDVQHQTFFNAQVFSAGVWYDPNTGNQSTSTINPGAAAFIQNAGSAATLTMVGTVPQGTNSITVAPGLNFVGDPVPVAQNTVTNGFPIVDNSLLYSFNSAANPQTYNQALVGGGPGSGGSGTGGSDWFDPSSGNAVGFTPTVGQGFVVFYAGNTSATWTRTFTVQ